MRANHNSIDSLYPPTHQNRLRKQKRISQACSFLLVLVGITLLPISFLNPSKLGFKKANAAKPVEQWKVDFERARKRKQQSTLVKMVDGFPGFAQMWFYGEVFSLAAEAFPKAQRAQLQATLNLIARRLSEKGEHRPLLLLERLNDPSGFAKLSKQVNRLQDRLFSQATQLMNFENRVRVCIEFLGNDQLEESTFYALLYRALFRTGVTGYMANPKDEKAFLRAAQPLAECRIIFGDDTTRWSVLKSYLREKKGGQSKDESLAPALSSNTLREQTLAELWNQWESKSWNLANKNMKRVIDIFKSKSSNDTRLSLAILLVSDAVILSKLGQLNQAIQRLERVMESAFLELDQRFLQATLKLTLADFLTEANQWDQVNTQLQGILEKPEAFEISRSAQQSAVLITQRLVKAVENLHEAGRNREAVSIFDITLKLFSVITDERYSSQLLPQSLRGRNLLDKRLARASFHALAARIYESTGQLEQAQNQLETARNSHPEPESARAQLLAWDLEKARLTLERGQIEETLTQLLPLSEILHKERRVSALATCVSIMSEAYHRLGNEKAAFVFANYGLELLSKAKNISETKDMHAQLHAQAAHGLIALGHITQGINRIQKSLQLKEDTTHRFKLAWLYNDLGQSKQAFEQLDLAKKLHLQRAIIRGCFMAQQGRYQEASEFLQAYTLTNSPKASIEGRLCLLYSSIMNNSRSDLGFLERPILSLQRLLKDPRYMWRLDSIKAIKLAKEKKFEAALQLALKSLEAWKTLKAERPIFGWHIESQVFAVPKDPTVIIHQILALKNQQKRNSKESVIQDLQLQLILQAYQMPLPQTRQAVLNELEPSLAKQLKQELKAASILSSLLSQATPSAEQLQKANQNLSQQSQQHTKLVSALFPKAQQLTPVAKALNLYLFEKAGNLYRLSIDESGKSSLKVLGSRKKIDKVLKKWRSALTESPRVIESKPSKRTPKKLIDPHSKLWKQSYQLARQLLPSSLFKAQSKDNLRAVVFWSYLDKDYPWGALVLDNPSKYTKGPSPRFLAQEFPVFSGLTSARTISANTKITRPSSTVKRIGPTNPIPCQVNQSNCLFNSQPLMMSAEKVSIGDKQKTLPLDAANGLLWSLPLDRSQFKQWTAKSHEAWTYLPSSLVKKSASWIHIEQSSITSQMIQLPLNNLHSQGVESFSWPLWSITEESLSRHLMSFKRGRSIATAERFAQLEALSTKIDLSVGGIPRYHPYFWAHTHFVHSSEMIEKSLNEINAQTQVTQEPSPREPKLQKSKLEPSVKDKPKLADPFADDDSLSSPKMKPQPKVEAKPEPKAEAKPEPKAEAKPDPKAEGKPEPKAEAKPEPKVEVKPEPRAEAKPESKAEAKPEPKMEVKPKLADPFADEETSLDSKSKIDSADPFDDEDSKAESKTNLDNTDPFADEEAPKKESKSDESKPSLMEPDFE